MCGQRRLVEHCRELAAALARPAPAADWAARYLALLPYTDRH